MDEPARTVVDLAAGRRFELSRADWRRLNRLLAQALELEHGQRDAWLRALTESDADLRPLLQHLLADSEAGGSAHPPTALPGTAPSPLHPAVATGSADAPGARVGPYQLLRELGVGGMGAVWLAERIDGTFARQVAMKLPRAEWTNSRLSEWMARERAALAALNHPNIAQMYDAGWTDDGRPYLALEYVDGVTIDRWCRDHCPIPSARVRLFIDVVRAVAFAHAKLVIHRDLKPSNVLVTADGRVKLLDFGIAKLLSADATMADDSALTRFCGRALTLNYAAPEQILGLPISTAADTYSLAVMLFELITESRPYRPVRDSRAALEEAIISVDPPLPSRVAVDPPAAHALRGDLDAILLKALRKQPEQRYETSAAFADDLERWLEQRPVRAQRSSGAYRIRRFVARHRTRVISGAIASVTALAVAFVLLWQQQVAGEESARAETVKSFVLAIIAQADPAASAATRDADLTLLTTAESRLASELAGNPALALELRVAIARAYRNRGEFERAGETLRQAIADAGRLLPASDPRLMRAWIEAAEWRIETFRDKIGPELDRAIEALRQRGRDGAEAAIEGLQLRSQRLGLAGDLRTAAADLREARLLAIKYFGAGHPKTLLATVRQQRLRDEPIAARLELTDSALRAALTNPDLPRFDPVFLELQAAHGRNLCEAGRGREGLALLQAAVDAARQQHSGALVTENALDSLSWGLFWTGDVAGMLRITREAYALAAAREPRRSFHRAVTANSVLRAALLARQIDGIAPIVSEAAQFDETRDWQQAMLVWLKNYEGDVAGAAALAPHALAIADRSGWAHWAESARLGWSFALRQLGQPMLAQRILEPLAQKSKPGELDLADVLKERSAVQLAIGDSALALETAEIAIGHLSKSKLRTDPHLADLQLTRGQALFKLGQPEEALAAFRVSKEFWDAYEPTSHWAAEAKFWLARALIEVGEASTGQPMLQAAQDRLANSPMPLHRHLASPAEAAR
jgi:eukaryotic-like serine/threonine-protein kinase